MTLSSRSSTPLRPQRPALLINKLLRALKFPPHTACVLMYHRVAELNSDVWDIAVTPANFEKQIQLLKKEYAVITAEELAYAVTKKAVRKNSVVVTFDDGYADNYEVAKPILDHYGTPATFFVASQTIDTLAEFWWDELENIILFTACLPASFSGVVGDQSIDFALDEEAALSEDARQLHQRWRVSTETLPTRRCALFFQLWKQLRLLPYPVQQQQLQAIRQWAGVGPGQRPTYRSMSLAQLQSLSQSSLHTIGVHTVSHPALAAHSLAFQKEEILSNQNFLQHVTEKKIAVAAYPYGSYNQDTVEVTVETGFRAAFTTESRPVTRVSDLYRLGRYQVQDWSVDIFAQQLRQWQQVQ